jgi:hypothetical protein
MIRANRRGAEIERKIVSDADGRHHHRDDGQHQNRHPVVEHPAQVHPQRGLEQQRRQKDIAEHVGPDRQAEDRLGHRVQRIGQLGPQEKAPAPIMMPRTARITV